MSDNKTVKLHLLEKQGLLDSFIEIKIVNGSDDFLKIKETLTRMGVANKASKNLYQSCHILHKKIDNESRYFIVHFKELFALDGRSVEMAIDDYARRNTIANTLESWNMLVLADKEKSKLPALGITEGLHRNMLSIISHKEKTNWNLQPKYQIGGMNKSKSGGAHVGVN